MERSGELELLRTRPWSALVRVPTSGGDVWFKESAPSLAFEAALTEFLAARRPDLVPEVLAAEGPRLLTADAGPQLRTLLAAGEPAPSWEQIVRLYAGVQVELSDSIHELLALGVPDSRPETLGHPVDGSVPASLIHEEVHDGNVHLRDGRPVFIDWAEASISHPFAGMTNTLRLTEGEDVFALRDAYLEPWTRYAPLDGLREEFEQAYVLGMLVRKRTWERTILPLPPAEREDFERNIEAWEEMYEEAQRGPVKLGE